MIGLLVAGVWCVGAVPVAVLIARGLRAMDPGEDPDPTPVVPKPDGAVDLLEGLPVDVLTPAEVDAMFVRLVAPLDREHR